MPQKQGWILGATSGFADLAPIAVFLASDAAGFVNGCILCVDGGDTAPL